MDGSNSFDISSLIIALGYSYVLGFLGYQMGKKRLIGKISGAGCCVFLGILGIMLVYFSTRLDSSKFKDRTVIRYLE